MAKLDPHLQIKEYLQDYFTKKVMSSDTTTDEKNLLNRLKTRQPEIRGVPYHKSLNFESSDSVEIGLTVGEVFLPLRLYSNDLPNEDDIPDPLAQIRLTAVASVTDTDNFDDNFEDGDTATISATIDHDGGAVSTVNSDGSQELVRDDFGEDGDKAKKIDFRIGSFNDFDSDNPDFYITIDVDSPTALTLDKITVEFPLITYGLIVSKSVTFDKSRAVR